MRGWPEGEAWKGFERVVAAVHKLRAAGAEVRWNEKIAGRQVDVTVRFTQAGYAFLILIECKNYAHPVPVGEVEAFITKARTLGADKAVMVASNGFQSGAREQAQRHSIELYTLEEIPQPRSTTFMTVPEPGYRLSDLRIDVAGQARARLAESADLAAVRFQPANWARELTLAEVAQYAKGIRELSVRQPQDFRVNFPSGCTASHPKLGPVPVPVASITFKATPAMLPVRSPVVPSDIPLMSYAYTDIHSGETHHIDAADLPVGFDTTFAAGRFYRNVYGMTYKCERVAPDEIQLFLISRQHGVDFAARFTIEPRFADRYVEIDSAAEMDVLQREYLRLSPLVTGPTEPVKPIEPV